MATRDVARETVVAEIPGNIGWIIRPSLCETKKEISESQNEHRGAKLRCVILKNYISPKYIAIVNIKYKNLCNSLFILD